MHHFKKLKGYSNVVALALLYLLGFIVLTVCAAWLKGGFAELMAEVGRLIVGVAKR